MCIEKTFLKKKPIYIETNEHIDGIQPLIISTQGDNLTHTTFEETKITPLIYPRGHKIDKIYREEIKRHNNKFNPLNIIAYLYCATTKNKSRLSNPQPPPPGQRSRNTYSEIDSDNLQRGDSKDSKKRKTTSSSSKLLKANNSRESIGRTSVIFQHDEIPIMEQAHISIHESGSQTPSELIPHFEYDPEVRKSQRLSVSDFDIDQDKILIELNSKPSIDAGDDDRKSNGAGDLSILECKSEKIETQLCAIKIQQRVAKNIKKENKIPMIEVPPPSRTYIPVFNTHDVLYFFHLPLSPHQIN